MPAKMSNLDLAEAHLNSALECLDANDVYPRDHVETALDHVRAAMDEPPEPHDLDLVARLLDGAAPLHWLPDTVSVYAADLAALSEWYCAVISEPGEREQDG
jgi:hypothetical protein